MRSARARNIASRRSARSGPYTSSESLLMCPPLRDMSGPRVPPRTAIPSMIIPCAPRARPPFAPSPAPYYIAAPIDRRSPSPRPSPERSTQQHGQETCGTTQNVHPHPLRAGPRRAVLPHPPMRRLGSQRRAPERVVRRHHALSRRPRFLVERDADHRAAHSGGALLPPRGGAQRDGGGERLTSRLTTTAETAGSAGPATAAPRRPSPAPRTIPGGAPALPPLPRA